MLEAAGIPFEAVESSFDEESAKEELRRLPPRDLAEALARGKASGVDGRQGDLILGSDQTLERADGSMLGKAATRGELREQLRSLRGAVHRLHSAAVILQDNKPAFTSVETATMSVRPFSDTFLEDYLDREFDTVRWSVGGYHAEGTGVQLFDRIEGSHFVVLGLPLLPLLGFLRQVGFSQP
jgi:septum formation protein